ncbi:MAG: hypothetical protein M1820_003631 [Bogoriella megaspora]|nr:MAG: hypothetical protein M1820_003631 [Bogoriella megaspora]
MPHKEKAVDSIDDRPSKRLCGLVASSASIKASDDASDGDETNNTTDMEVESTSQIVSKFSASSYTQRHNVHRDQVSYLFKSHRDHADLLLKPDRDKCPLWIDFRNGRVVMENFSTLSKPAQQLLIAIAEPQSRTANIQEYTITVNSLVGAQTIGGGAQGVIRELETLSKIRIPEAFKNWILESSRSWGQVRLVLKQGKYFIESQDAAVLQKLLRDDIINSCRVDTWQKLAVEKAPRLDGLVIPGTKDAAGLRQVTATQDRDGIMQERQGDAQCADGGRKTEEMISYLSEDYEKEANEVYSFQIMAEKVATVRERSQVLGLPVTEEYDFRNDAQTDLDIVIDPSVHIRYYQEHALSKMFGNGRCKSGIIVLPCGAGKTLIGITAVCTIKRSAVVLCTSTIAAVQWRNEFLERSNIKPADIAIFTSDQKEPFRQDAGIVISTYTMVSQTKQRAHDSQQMMNFLQAREWGIMILDEVHVVPADMFRKVTHSILSYTKLGLTATLLREDDKIQDLNFLIGPKLYEANWLQLSEEGYIARVQCAEVWCPMAIEFHNEYLKARSVSKRILLFTMNPRKFQTCQYLIQYHENRGDKIIVFSDNIYVLKKYATLLGKFMIHGKTPQHEREHILLNFQHNPKVNTLFLSKVGDTSLDLPEATCLIQISSHYGSRRQEAQRLGRILRAKRRNDEGFNAFFYSLVSKDTDEMHYSAKRQAFLVDQGYAFKVITHLQGIENLPDLHFTNERERQEILADVLLQSEDAGGVEHIEDDLFGGDNIASGRGERGTSARTTAGTLSGLSGGQSMPHNEHNASQSKEPKQKGPQNAFMKKLQREQDKKRVAKQSLTNSMYGNGGQSRL